MVRPPAPVALLLVAACAAPEPVTPDPRLATLPPDASLVVAMDAPSLLSSPALSELLAGAGFAPQVLTGLAGAPGLRIDDVRLGCDEVGCVALLEGDFAEAPAAIEALLARPPAGLDVGRAGGELPGVDAVNEAGDDLVLRILADDKAVFGDRAAVQAAWERRGGGGLDAAAVAAAVPPSENWVLLRAPARLEAAVAARLALRRPGAGAAWRTRVARVRAEVPELDGVESLGVGLSPGVPGVRVRASCRDEAMAEALAARGAGPGREVVRAGRVVDVAGALRWGAP